MRQRRGLPFAPVIFSLVVVLAVGAIAWGASHNKTTATGIGSAKDQKAARATLLTGLHLPASLVRDPTFTACGNISDACLTGSTSVSSTLATLTTVVDAAGGSLADVCTATPSNPNPNLPSFTCVAQGELKGATVVFLMGDGWLLPGQPTPKTAVLATVVTSKTAARPTPTTGTQAEAAALLPATWVSAVQACVPASAAPVPASTTSAPAPSATTSPSPLLPTSPPLATCTPNAITLNVGVHLYLAQAAAQFSALAVSKGFRLDGHPCIGGATLTSCGVWGERITAGVEELFVATLADDGHGSTTGTLAVTDQS